MNRRALCGCYSVAKTATRCERLHSSPCLAFTGYLPSRQICHTSTTLQSIGEEVAKDGKQARNSGLVPEAFPDVWQKELQDLVKARPEEARNVFVNDLSATLEAHRAANRASVVRRLNQKANWKSPWKTSKDFSNIDTTSSSTETPTLSKDQNASSDRNAAEVSTGQCLLDPEDFASKGRKLKKSSRKGVGRNDNPVKERTPGIIRMNLSQRRRHWPADSVQNQQVTAEKYHHNTSEPLEYEGIYISPVGEFDTKRWRTRDYPWLTGLGSYVPGGRNGSALQRLHDELKGYEKFMRLGPVEREAAEIFTADVTSLVQKVLPNSPVLPIGSHSTGLADRLSDFDFSISLPDLEKSPLERGPSPTRPKACKVRAKALSDTRLSLAKSFHFVQPVELIHARVPIVKATHRITRFRVELQVLGSHQATQEFTMAYLAEFPTLRPLYVVFRSALHIRRLNIVHEGGLGSYSILMMIINALKHASGRFAQDDLASHFLYVLEFYGDADLYKYGFSPDPPRTVPKQAKLSADEKIARLRDPYLRGIDILLKANPKKPYLLCLQDPANPVNDLGSKAYGIKHIQKLFRSIRQGLKINMAAWEGSGNFQNAWQPHALLAELLGAKYVGLEEQRLQVKNWVKEKNQVYKTKGWRQLAFPSEGSKGQLEPSTHPDDSSGDASDMAAMKPENGQLQVDKDGGLDDTRLNLDSVNPESENNDEVTARLGLEAHASTDSSATHRQPTQQDLHSLNTSVPERDATASLPQNFTDSGSTTGGWKKWVPPPDTGLANTEEQPSDLGEQSLPSALSQVNVKVELRKSPLFSDSKRSSWKKWSPPTKDEMTEQPLPCEPTPQSKSNQVDPQVKADQVLKETGTYRGSPMSKANADRKRKSHNPAFTSGKPRDSKVIPPQWWSEQLRSPPQPRMWYDFPSELEELRMDSDSVKKIKDMEWSELANALDISRLKSIYRGEDGNHALAIALVIRHHARSALWRFKRRALNNKLRNQFFDGLMIASFDNPRGHAALSAARASCSKLKSKYIEEFHQEAASVNGSPAATLRNDAIEKSTHALDALGHSLAPGRSGSNKLEVAKNSDIDEDRIEHSQTGGSSLPIGYEAPVPNLDYSNKREQAVTPRFGHSAKSEKAVPQSTNGNESAVDSEIMPKQSSMLYSSYRRRRKKALLQMQVKRGQLGLQRTPISDSSELAGGKYFRVHASKKAPHVRSESRGGDGSTSAQEASMDDASGMPEPRPDGGPAPEFWAKYEALDRLKKERGWGPYRDPHTVPEPLPEVPSQSAYTQALLTRVGSDPKDDDLAGTSKFFHKKLSGPPPEQKKIFHNNTPIIEKLNPEAHKSLEEQYRSSLRAADDERSSSLPPKASKKSNKQAKRKERYRALARVEARRAGQLLKKGKKLAKLEKTREIQAKYTALREKLRRERRGKLVGDRELKDGISEEKRGSVKWMEEL